MSDKKRKKSFYLNRADIPTKALREQLLYIYQLMFDHFGDRHWWPAETREEVIIGAILVQNVSWASTVKAINKLREQHLLTFKALSQSPLEIIETCIISTRYYRMKAKKLKAFAQYLEEEFSGNLDACLAQPMNTLRGQLLAIYGIGPETADDILLYAAERPSFVVDAYTKRIFHRLGYIEESIPYEELRQWFMLHLPENVALYNQYHALLDATGHHYCSTRNPDCRSCPLLNICHYGAATG